MKTSNINRHTPLKLKNGQFLRNRIVVPPMASQTASQEGLVTNNTLEHYARLATANPGLLIVEYTFVHISGRSEPNQLGIQNDATLSGLKDLAQVIKQNGALAGIQLTHSGGKTERAYTNGTLMAPSDIPVPVKDRNLETPTPMSFEDIKMWKQSFLEGVHRAAQAGFDLVEFHSAHGYGLNQWLSPITNHRTDSYGGDLSHRMKLLTEIVTEARMRHPNLLFSVRLPGRDFSDQGLQIDDTQILAMALEKIGVDILHVSSGIGGWKRPSERVGEGYLVPEAKQIQSIVQIPVIGVGGIETGKFIDEGLKNHLFSLSAVGRAILKGPLEWYEGQFLEDVDCHST